AGGTFPQNGRLALIGNADAGNVVSSYPRALQRLPCDRHLRRPDSFGIVLHMTGLGKELFELLLRNRHYFAFAVEDDGAAGGGSLVEGQDMSFHCWNQLPRDTAEKNKAGHCTPPFYVIA